MTWRRERDDPGTTAVRRGRRDDGKGEGPAGTGQSCHGRAGGTGQGIRRGGFPGRAGRTPSRRSAGGSTAGIPGPGTTGRAVPSAPPDHQVSERTQPVHELDPSPVIQATCESPWPGRPANLPLPERGTARRSDRSTITDVSSVPSGPMKVQVAMRDMAPGSVLTRPGVRGRITARMGVRPTSIRKPPAAGQRSVADAARVDGGSRAVWPHDCRRDPGHPVPSRDVVPAETGQSRAGPALAAPRRLGLSAGRLPANYLAPLACHEAGLPGGGGRARIYTVRPGRNMPRLSAHHTS